MRVSREMRQNLILVAIGLLLTGLALVWLFPAFLRSGDHSTGEALIRSEFTLVDHRGRQVTQDDYAERWQLVFFGFTSCPDVCPTTLDRVTGVLEGLDEEAAEVAPLFITVDPERDTPPVMASYITAFDPRIVGLTGTPGQVTAALKSFRVYAQKVDQPGAAYTMDHSAFLYLMAADGSYVTHFPPQAEPEAIIAKIRGYLS